ncbi:hypothetical protein EUTSA_v10021901mg [Eutrema salsugineum]|uniref:Uncharacterized protein n=1 Tax=Eutrema salsugineum TaxID=72664 RepID=V4M8H8_EUTSA|nr:hypothetical protein EUTSA_v10021901mg [Eutrema salsugineum]
MKGKLWLIASLLLLLLVFSSDAISLQPYEFRKLKEAIETPCSKSPSAGQGSTNPHTTRKGRPC